jgi:hypothetical protein
MASIITRQVAGSGAVVKNLPLSNSEIDLNFINLNTDKIEETDAVSTNTINKVVRRDSSGGFSCGDITSSGNITVNGGNLTTEASTFNLLNASATTLNLGGAATSITLGADNSGTFTIRNSAISASNSNTTIKSLGVGTTSSNNSGEIRATGDITSNYSDQRLKEDITTIPCALEKVEMLRGVYYKPNSIAESFGYKKQQEVGVLAQDVLSVLPEAIKPAPFDILRYENTEISRSGENYMTVQYEKIIPLLIEAIKELNKEVKELKGVR